VTRTLLIDADILAYRTSSATQKAYQWDAETRSVAADMDAAIRFAEEEIERLADRLQADDVIVCLSDDFNSFRKSLVDPSYKELRATAERPENLYPMKAWLRENYLTEERAWLEADDVMGIISTDPSRTDERIIVSADKDMMTVPGKLYRPQHQAGAKKPRILDITPLEGIRFHFWQTIVGDTTDGYPGAPGVGHKSPYAEDVLFAESEEAAWEEVLMAFATRGGEPAAIRQARLARILQFPDYDGRVRLWLPPAYEPDEVDETL
jgi:5'-3' exonuclease